MTDTKILDPRLIVILEQHPYLSYGKLQEREYLGIIQNADSQMISMYVLDLLPNEIVRQSLLDFGAQWWNNSNRMTPINIFIKNRDFKAFRICLRHFSAKDFDIISGPSASLAEMIARRVRRRQIAFGPTSPVVE